ncbi:MAG TPA: hypothetical protein VMS17_10390 [Gemmataceae bacterium]|nr:hypothetical protein [Gemmataceae bacterium]
MSNPSLRAHHPPPFKTVTAVSLLKEKQPFFYLVVAGRKLGVKRVRVSVNEVRGERRALHTREGPLCVKHGRDWIFVVPLNLAAATTTACTVTVVQAEDTADALSASFPLTIVTPSEEAIAQMTNPKMLGGNITVQYPITSPPNVCPSFPAYGQLVDGGQTTGATMESATRTYNGTPVTRNVPAGMWMYQFSGLADDTYDFTVTDNQGNVGSVTGVQVSASDCVPVVAPGSGGGLGGGGMG